MSDDEWIYQLSEPWASPQWVPTSVRAICPHRWRPVVADASAATPVVLAEVCDVCGEQKGDGG